MFGKIQSRIESNSKLLAYLLVAPTLIVVFAILVYPLMYSLAISFSSVTLRDMTFNFIGLKNYIEAFTDPKLGHSFILTLQYLIGTLSAKLVIGMGGALILKEKFIGRGLARSLIIIPWATPLIVSGLIWKWIFNSKVGLLNFILFKLGIIDNYKAWLSQDNFALWGVSIADIWQGTPFFIIILLAGLQTIPDDIYEAADIDGAGSFRKFFSITLPMVKFQLIISIILGTIAAVNQFDLFFIMTKGGPADVTTTAIYYNYQTAFKYWNSSYASTISYLILVFSAIIALAYAKVVRSDEN